MSREMTVDASSKMFRSSSKLCRRCQLHRRISPPTPRRMKHAVSSALCDVYKYVSQVKG